MILVFYSIDEVLKALKYSPGISKKEKRRIEKEWIYDISYLNHWYSAQLKDIHEQSALLIQVYI